MFSSFVEDFIQDELVRVDYDFAKFKEIDLVVQSLVSTIKDIFRKLEDNYNCELETINDSVQLMQVSSYNAMEKSREILIDYVKLCIKDPDSLELELEDMEMLYRRKKQVIDQECWAMKNKKIAELFHNTYAKNQFSADLLDNNLNQLVQCFKGKCDHFNIAYSKKELLWVQIKFIEEMRNTLYKDKLVDNLHATLRQLDLVQQLQQLVVRENEITFIYSIHEQLELPDEADTTTTDDNNNGNEADIEVDTDDDDFETIFIPDEDVDDNDADKENRTKRKTTTSIFDIDDYW